MSYTRLGVVCVEGRMESAGTGGLMMRTEAQYKGMQKTWCNGTVF